jgi:hypothetical protein
MKYRIVGFFAKNNIAAIDTPDLDQKFKQYIYDGISGFYKILFDAYKACYIERIDSWQPIQELSFNHFKQRLNAFRSNLGLPEGQSGGDRGDILVNATHTSILKRDLTYPLRHITFDKIVFDANSPGDIFTITNLTNDADYSPGAPLQLPAAFPYHENTYYEAPQTGFLVDGDLTDVYFGSPSIHGGKDGINKDKKIVDAVTAGGSDIVKFAKNELTGSVGMQPIITINKGGQIIPSSLGAGLNDYLYILKLWILQNLLKFFSNKDGTVVQQPQQPPLPAVEIINNDKLKTELGEQKTKLVELLKGSSIVENQNSVMFTMVAKIAEELLHSHMKHYIQRGAQYQFGRLIRKVTKGVGDITLPKPDTGFRLNLSKIYDNFDTTVGNYDADYDKYQLVGKPMEDDKDPNPFQYPVYSQDYAQMQFDAGITYCYTLNDEAINKLLEYHWSINLPDSYQCSPLFYAIDLNYPKLVKKLLDAKASIYMPINIKDETPMLHLINNFKLHCEFMNGKDPLINFYNGMYKDLSKQLRSVEGYDNNIPRFLKLVYPIVLVCYNEYFSEYRANYDGDWTYEKEMMLQNILKENGICNNFSLYPLLNFPEEIIKESLDKGSSLGVLSEDIEKEEKDNKKRKTRIELIDKQIMELNKAKDALDKTDREYAVRLSKIDKRIHKIEATKGVGIDTKPKKSKLVSLSGAKVLDIKTKSNTFNGNLTNFDNDRCAIYDNYFTKVLHNKDEYPDYGLFIQLWEKYISIQSTRPHYATLHVCLIKLWQQLLESKTVHKQSKTINMLDALYQSVYSKFLTDKRELPETYSENHGLKQTLDCVEFGVKLCINSSLYLAIIQTLFKYIEEQTGSIPQAQAAMKILLGEKPGGQTLANYIFDILPKRAIKMSLKIYEDDDDGDKMYETAEDLTKPIIDIITGFSSTTFEKTIPMIVGIEENILPLYGEVFTKCIPQLFTMITNYDNYITNEQRMVAIFKDMVIASLTDPELTPTT